MFEKNSVTKKKDLHAYLTKQNFTTQFNTRVFQEIQIKFFIFSHENFDSKSADLMFTKLSQLHFGSSKVAGLDCYKELKRLQLKYPESNKDHLLLQPVSPSLHMAIMPVSPIPAVWEEEKSENNKLEQTFVLSDSYTTFNNPEEPELFEKEIDDLLKEISMFLDDTPDPNDFQRYDNKNNNGEENRDGRSVSPINFGGELRESDFL